MGLKAILSDIGNTAGNMAKDMGGDILGGLGSAVSSTFRSSAWIEYFESGDMSNGILMKRGQKIVGPDSKNRKGDDNIITSGSLIDVQVGQCMILVDNGRIVELCTVPGRYQFDSSSAPSWFCGENKGLKAVAKEVIAQWSAGGQRVSTQRVYFINMGELIQKPIKWGCGDIAFHHVQVYKATGSMLEMDMTLRANGEATIQITDPVKFFNVIGAQKVGGDNDGLIKVTDDGIYSNLRSGILDHISSAISTLGFEQSIPYTAIKAKTADIKGYLNAELEKDWVGKRGFGIANFSFNGSPMPSEDSDRELREMQQSFNMSQNVNAMNYNIQRGYSQGAQAMGEGFKAAGENGVFGQAAMAGAFVGGQGVFGAMSNGMGNIQGQPLPNQQPGYQQPVMQQPVQQAPAQQAPVAPAVAMWACSCGSQNEGAFCRMCGSRKPEAGVQQPTSATWTCTCGNANEINSRFCPNCGSKKPTVKKYKCDKCGWEPAEGTGATTRFCPNCGDPFNDADVTEV